MGARVTLALWFLLSGVGATLVALPDSGRRIFSFSGEHGPSVVDGIGALLLIAASCLVTASTLRRWASVGEALRQEPVGMSVLSFAGGLGLGLVLAGVFTDFWWWWLVGAALIQAVQFVLWVVAFKDPGDGR